MATRLSASTHHYSRTLSAGSQTQLSMACWVQLSADRNDISGILSLGGTGFFELLADTDGTTVGIIDENTSSPRGGRNLSVGTWYYFAASMNGANGTVISRSATDTSFTVNTWSDGPSSVTVTDLYIGRSRLDAGWWLNGRVAAVKFWVGATLTQAELEAEAWTYLPVRGAGLRVWAPLAKPETTDYSGNGNTLSGGTGATTEDGPPIPWRRTRRRPVLPVQVPAEVTPALIQATVSVPTPAVSVGTTVTPGLIVAPASVPTPDVFVGGAVTPVNPARIDAPATVPTPAVSTVKNVSITAPRIAATALVRTPTVSVPITPGSDLTGKGQISYNGFKLGGGTVYRLINMIGGPWDMPGLDGGDEPHPSADGALPGQDLAQARILTLEFRIRAPKDEIEAAAEAFVQGLPKAQADERLPIAIQVIDTIWIGYGRCTARAATVDKNTPIGLIGRASVQFTMSDPRFYSRALQSAEVADGGDIDVSNSGNCETFPLIRMPGPATNPLIEITRILPDGGEDIRVIQYEVTADIGESLILDVKRGTVLLGAESQARYRVNGSVSIPDMVLGPGVSTIAYETDDGDAPAAVVLWNHATM